MTAAIFAQFFCFILCFIFKSGSHGVGPVVTSLNVQPDVGSNLCLDTSGNRNFNLC